MSYIKTINSKTKLINNVIKALDKLKKEYPDTEITIETIEGTVSCKISQANIYDDTWGNVIIDAE